MNCLSCSEKKCKSHQQDCNKSRREVLKRVDDPELQGLYKDADSLISNGRAGTLSRLQEITEFCVSRNYKTIGIAYCYGIEGLALETSEHLKNSGLEIKSYRCTINGIKEHEISRELGSSVGCNPVGQALAIEQDGTEFIIEMGLCLGHDLMFHRFLKVPHTVFIVKDRVNFNNPARALASYKDNIDGFIHDLDDNFNMRSPAWLSTELKGDNPPLIVDVRSETGYKGGHIRESINIPLRTLPDTIAEIRLKSEGRETITVCGGGIISSYAAMYLYTKGCGNILNLSGGISRWEREGYTIVPS